MDILKVWNTLEMFRMMVADMPSSDPKFRAWLGIYPINPNSVAGCQFLTRQGVAKFTGQSFFHVRFLELDVKFLSDNYHPCESDFATITSQLVRGRLGLATALHEFGVAVVDLKMPYESDYPI
ncbi:MULTISPECIES: hypothetical protein [Dyella]|uniref:Uncharacterized protein n=2 Tax=Dyella TaxID=231454 RepID=A0A4R0Z0R6_9GAMM|nr:MULTISPECIES: hypothetical protein [Dyella]TBR40598.1 hypothetical protein EYV96_10715 [Dyella terrae]TCI11820.1 hypothetical protein EZM97_00155 [Dyella soli]